MVYVVTASRDSWGGLLEARVRVCLSFRVLKLQKVGNTLWVPSAPTQKVPCLLAPPAASSTTRNYLHPPEGLGDKH